MLTVQPERSFLFFLHHVTWQPDALNEKEKNFSFINLWCFFSALKVPQWPPLVWKWKKLEFSLNKLSLMAEASSYSKILWFDGTKTYRLSPNPGMQSLWHHTQEDGRLWVLPKLLQPSTEEKWIHRFFLFFFSIYFCTRLKNRGWGGK